MVYLPSLGWGIRYFCAAQFYVLCFTGIPSLPVLLMGIWTQTLNASLSTDAESDGCLNDMSQRPGPDTVCGQEWRWGLLEPLIKLTLH